MVSNLKNKLNGKTLLNSDNIGLGMEVKLGNGLGILWALCAILLIGVVPYFMVSDSSATLLYILVLIAQFCNL